MFRIGWNYEIGWYEFGDEGCKAIAAVLPQSQITALNMSNSQIEEEGATAIAIALPHSQVATLDMSCNKFGDAGAKALAAALPQSKITSLNIYAPSNYVKKPGRKALKLAKKQSNRVIDLRY